MRKDEDPVLARRSQSAAAMTPWNTKPLSSSPSASVPRSRWASLVARVRASTWTAIAARVAAVVVALLVLGWIGRTAAAGPATTTMSVSAGERDASTPPLPALVASDAGAPLLAVTATDRAPTTPPASGPHGRATPEEPVYLNQASVEELRRLPGVGPKRAEAILVLRQRLGRFQRVEDLLRVKGVGRGAVKKWRPLVRLDAPPPPSAPALSGASGAADGGST
ncbi:MAG: competence protein ComEA [Myxococcales bacterium]|nr:competence protein ComEA [Myxococcales bacterium]